MSAFTETCYEPIIGEELSRFLCGNMWVDDRGHPIAFKKDGTVEVYSEYHEKMIRSGGDYTTQKAAFRPGYDSYYGSFAKDCGEKGVCHTWDQCSNLTDGPAVVYVGEHVFISNLKRDHDLGHVKGVFPVVAKDKLYLYVINGRGRDRKPIIFAQCDAPENHAEIEKVRERDVARS